jgi:hypothetical protein
MDRTGLYPHKESDIGQMLFGGGAYKVQKAQVKANRLIQAANNEKGAAESELQRFSAGLANRRRMDAAGENIANLEGHIARNIDAKNAGDLQGQLATAEELGRSASMAAAAGVGGSTIDAYNHTVKLRAALEQGVGDRAFDADLYAANHDKGAILEDAVAGLDNNQYRANLDYRRWVDPKKPSVFQQIATLGVAAAATYFGGPQAGMAVIGASDSLTQAQNGDFAGASSTFNNSIKLGVSAYNDTRSMGGDNYWSQPKFKANYGANIKI